MKERISPCPFVVYNAVISQQQLKHMTAAIVVAYQIVRATVNDRPSPLCISSFSQTLPVVRHVNYHVGFCPFREGRRFRPKRTCQLCHIHTQLTSAPSASVRLSPVRRICDLSRGLHGKPM